MGILKFSIHRLIVFIYIVKYGSVVLTMFTLRVGKWGMHFVS